MKGMEEKDLVEACRHGDEGAFAELFRLYSHPLYGVCRRYMGNSADADDVFQDGFISIISGIGKFSYRGPGSFRAWASKIMVNTALSNLRGRLRRSEPLSEAERSVAEIDEEAVSEIPGDVLQEFIIALPDGYRTVLNMFVFEKMSHREIAGQLNISEATSASQLLRAKRRLAEMIKEYRCHEERE